MIAPAEDRWPAGGEVPDDALGQVLLASHLLGSDRAVANFGGGNTSAKGTATDHVGREVDVMWVKGSGSDLATMEREHFTPLRLDEMLAVFERDEMSDEDMVAHLARCQVDPAAPRSSIETLLHAFVPAPHVHHTHPDGINVLAGTRDGERLVAECFGDEAAWIPYIRPGFTLAKQVGTAVRENPDLKLVVLAKHGLVVWGDTAEEAYRRTIEVINRAVEFVNARTAGEQRFDGPAGRAERRGAAARCCRRCAARSRASGAKVLVVDTSPRAREFVSSRAAPELVTVGAACPDHLVHTKRVPLWIPFDPSSEDADDAGRADPRAGGRVPRRLPRLRRRRRAPSRPTPTRASCSSSTSAWSASAPTTKDARLSRDLYHRAIEVMAGRARARRLRLARRGGELRRSSTGRSSSTSSRWRRRPASCRAGSRSSPAPPAASAARSSSRSPSAGACVVGFDLDAEGAADAVGERRRLASPATSPPRRPCAAAFAAAVDAYGGVDIVVSNAGVASSAPIEETTLAEWERNHAILGTGYFLVAREAFRVLREQGRGGSIVFVASKNALVAGKNAAAYSSAKAAELHLARCLAEEGGERRHPRQHGQPRRRAPGLADLGLELARGARRRLRHRARTSWRSTTASGRRWA